MSARLETNERKGSPKISFLIPMYNGLELTRVCLRTLEETVDLTEHEVILIDDASTDGTKEFLDKLPAPYQVLHNERRSSYAMSMNRGAASASGELLCLLNNDLIFQRGWLTPMLATLENFPQAGFIGNVQKNPRTGAYDHMGIVFDPNGGPWHYGKYFRFQPFGGVTEWRAVTAACCLIRKEIFLAAGGFDEAYKNGCEDTDLCLRLGKVGRRHYVANASVIYHHVSSSEGRHDFNTQNERLFGERWRPSVVASLTREERRRFAANYLLRFITRPWRYNGKKLRKSLATLWR